MADCSLNKENDRAENKSEKCVTADEEWKCKKVSYFKNIYYFLHLN